jgi:hypothetical protein
MSALPGRVGGKRRHAGWSPEEAAMSAESHNRLRRTDRLRSPRVYRLEGDWAQAG